MDLSLRLTSEGGAATFLFSSAEGSFTGDLEEPSTLKTGIKLEDTDRHNKKRRTQNCLWYQI